MALNSSDVSAGDNILAAHHNNLIDDIEQHTHDGTDTAAINATYAGDGLALAGAVLSVNVDDSTIEVSGDSLQVKNYSITSEKIGYKAGSELIISADTERTTSNTAYTVLKDIDMGTGGTVTVSFDAKGDTAGSGIYCYARIYVNGVAQGTERTLTSTSYSTYEENITYEQGDNIQLYARRGVLSDPYVRNFRIYAEIQNVADSVVTN